MNTPKVKKRELLSAFELLCKKMGVVSKGFHPESITAPIDGEKYDGTKQWAMKKTSFGWMVVCGKGGMGAVLSRWNGYIKGRWNFLMMIEAVTWAEIVK
jgi:hypothetical protein